MAYNQGIAAMARRAAAAFALTAAMAGCAYVESDDLWFNAVSETPQLSPGRTYALVSLDGLDDSVGDWVLCRKPDDGRYTFSQFGHTRNWCDPEWHLRFGRHAPLTVSEAAMSPLATGRMLLADGTPVAVMAISDLNGADPGPESGGAYVIGGRVEQNGTRDVMRLWNFETHEYPLTVGKAHYLGHLSADYKFRPRDGDAMRAMLAKSFPGVAPERFVVAPPETLEVRCGNATSTHTVLCKLR